MLRFAGGPLGAVWRRGLRVADRILSRLGMTESETAIVRAADAVWNRPPATLPRSDAHWRGAGSFADDSLWLDVGARHLAMFQAFARAVDFDRPLGCVVDWGCGGGANAVHFGPLATTYIAVDVADATLEECRRQATQAGTRDLRTVRIEVADPEAAIDAITVPCDLFICTFVLELVPTRAYGLRLLRIAERLLAPGGVAFVQIKYDTGSWRTAALRRSYARNYAAMTTYRIDEFWLAAAASGLTPHLVTLVPDHRLDPRYAYFLLQKPA